MGIEISQSQPPLTTKGSGDLGSISSHEDPTPIGDAGCPWEWPPTDVTPRDIILEGLPPPSPLHSINKTIAVPRAKFQNEISIIFKLWRKKIVYDNGLFKVTLRDYTLKLLSADCHIPEQITANCISSFLERGTKTSTRTPWDCYLNKTR